VCLGTGASLALATGCGGKPSAAARGPAQVTIESTTTASQAELAAAFPEGKFQARCAYVESDLPRFERMYTISAGQIDTYFEDQPDRHQSTYLEQDAQFETKRSSAWDAQQGILLLDGMIYLTEHKSLEPLHAFAVCTVDGDLDRAARKSAAQHDAELNAYAARRAEVVKVAAASAKAAADAEAAEAAEAAEDEQLDRLERLDAIESLRLTAGASGPKAEVSLSVTATLEDGSTMRIGQGDPIFREAFGTKIVHGTTAMMVEVWYRDDKTIRDQREIGYSFDIEHTFECHGKAGLTGHDFDSARGMYYHGRKGEDGPDLTVEITTTGRTTDDGRQILRYRVGCDGRSKVFVTSESAPVHVGTYGGKGGHGVQLASGAGGNGGNGGDGGDITVTVDPSVRRYKLVPVSEGGKGGAPSDARGASDVSAYGKRGNDGASGDYAERREPVEIP